VRQEKELAGKYSGEVGGETVTSTDQCAADELCGKQGGRGRGGFIGAVHRGGLGTSPKGRRVVLIRSKKKKGADDS